MDVVQKDGSLVRAGQVTYLLNEERALALPADGGQVFSHVPGTEETSVLDASMS